MNYTAVLAKGEERDLYCAGGEDVYYYGYNYGVQDVEKRGRLCLCSICE